MSQGPSWFDTRANMAYDLTKSKSYGRPFMPTTTTHARKSKITVTLSPDLIRQLDALLISPELGSRSRLVEEALRCWLRDCAQQELERQTEVYYRSLSTAERKEDQQWTKIAARSARQHWE